MNIAARTVLPFAVAALAFASLPAAAQEAAGPTVSVFQANPNGQFYFVQYQAGPGENNQVTIATEGSGSTTQWLVSEQGFLADGSGTRLVLNVGPGCTRLDDHTARCFVPEDEGTNARVIVKLGDGNDFASTKTACGYSSYDDNYVCDAKMYGGDGADVLHANDHETRYEGTEPWGSVAYGGDGGDTLYAGDSGSAMYGGTRTSNGPCEYDHRATAGCDRLFGDTGHDHLDGGDGGDVIEGRGGDDVITGGAGRDSLFGHGGDDTIYARDDKVDTVAGGRDTDRAQVDRGRDDVRSVERFF